MADFSLWLMWNGRASKAGTDESYDCLKILHLISGGFLLIWDTMKAPLGLGLDTNPSFYMDF